MKNIFFIILILSLKSNFSISQVTFQYGKYVRYDGNSIEVNYGSNSPNHVNYPDFNYRSDWNDYNTSSASLRLFIKYGCGNHKLTKPFVFVEGVSFEKPIKQNTYSLTEYLNMYNGDNQVSNKQDLVNARNAVYQVDWNENATVGYSTFNWATLVTGIDAEGLDDGDPLQVQKSPELLQKLHDNGYDIVFVDPESSMRYTKKNNHFLQGHQLLSKMISIAKASGSIGPLMFSNTRINKQIKNKNNHENSI